MNVKVTTCAVNTQNLHPFVFVHDEACFFPLLLSAILNVTSARTSNTSVCVCKAGSLVQVFDGAILHCFALSHVAYYLNDP